MYMTSANDDGFRSSLIGNSKGITAVDQWPIAGRARYDESCVRTHSCSGLSTYSYHAMLLTGQCNTNSNILYYLVHQHGVIAILHTFSTKICLSTSFSKPVRRSSLKKRVRLPIQPVVVVALTVVVLHLLVRL